MGKKKTTQTQQNTYQYMTPTETPDIANLRAQIGQSYDTADPSIGYHYGKRREQAQNRFANPFGPNYSPEVIAAQRYNDLNEIDQEQGIAQRMDVFNRRQAKVGALGGLASQTAPQLVGTGSSGTTTQSGSPWGAIIGAGAQIGQAALM